MKSRRRAQYNLVMMFFIITTTTHTHTHCRAGLPQWVSHSGSNTTVLEIQQPRLKPVAVMENFFVCPPQAWRAEDSSVMPLLLLMMILFVWVNKLKSRKGCKKKNSRELGFLTVCKGQAAITTSYQPKISLHSQWNSSGQSFGSFLFLCQVLSLLVQTATHTQYFIISLLNFCSLNFI